MPRLTQDTLRVQTVFAYAAITLYGPTFQRGSTNDWIGNSTVAGPTTPETSEDVLRFGLFPISLATTFGIAVAFFSSRY